MVLPKGTLAYMMDPVEHYWKVSPEQVQGMLDLMTKYFKACDAAKKEYESSMKKLLRRAYKPKKALK